jgi:hypothetical protein
MDRGLGLRRGRIPGGCASGVARIGLTPLADPIDVVSAFEVVAVGGFCDPAGLGSPLAGEAAGGLVAMELTGPVACARGERVIAGQALDRGPGASHRPEEDARGPTEANRRGGGKKTEKKEERLRLRLKKTPPRRRRRCRISNRQSQGNFSSALTTHESLSCRKNHKGTQTGR